MELTQEQIIQNQVAEKARHAATVASATGSLAKNAFLATITRATTVGDRAVVFGTMAGFVSFFLPWISFLGTVSASGLRAAIEASWVFWLHPLSMVACFLMFSFNKEAEAKKRILAARWYIVIGTFGSGLELPLSATCLAVRSASAAIWRPPPPEPFCSAGFCKSANA